MPIKLLLLVLCLLPFVLCFDLLNHSPNELRLVRLSENSEPIWMSMEEIFELKRREIGFFDITSLRTHSLSVPSPPPLPNQPQQKKYVNSLLSGLSKNNLQTNVQTLSSFKTRYYTTTTGVQAAEWIYETVTAYASGRDDITVSFFNSSTTAPQPSVIAQIKGVMSQDLVIIGSHEDSINLGAFGNAPGVDDDGSGVVSLLEIFRNLVDQGFYPNRTIEFHFYAAEEVGLKGSKAVAQAYAEQQKTVVGMLQLDMTFYIGKNGENVVGIVTDFVDNDLTQFVRELVIAYTSIPYVNTVCGYGCSDHASWNSEGYRAAFPFESQFSQHNPYIHSAQDTLEYADLDHGLEFAKLGTGFVVELASTNYRS